ncbi:hypothetical protein EYF80_051274 [Liparis tanakae]|uniref:Uncharacterized protein n=1 Tax=Liparis tanakae TaxID=230148 RepID=A0A4Z2FBJ4_9TELE|nr:hypothetical protein EYF80_051274 [Liparis tanakae]
MDLSLIDRLSNDDQQSASCCSRFPARLTLQLRAASPADGSRGIGGAFRDLSRVKSPVDPVDVNVKVAAGAFEPPSWSLTLDPAYGWQEGGVAQLPDGPVDWPRCIQLVHGAHSSRRGHWCPAAFPGTRINAAPLGGPKRERISNSNSREAPESQGMTLDGEPSTTSATTLKPPLPRADGALTWPALGPPPPPPCPLLLSGPHRSKESKASQIWSTRNIRFLFLRQPERTQLRQRKKKNPEWTVFSKSNGAERSRETSM